MVPQNALKFTPTQKAIKIPVNPLKPQIWLQLLSEMLCGDHLWQEKAKKVYWWRIQHVVVTTLEIEHIPEYLLFFTDIAILVTDGSFNVLCGA